MELVDIRKAIEDLETLRSEGYYGSLHGGTTVDNKLVDRYTSRPLNILKLLERERIDKAERKKESRKKNFINICTAVRPCPGIGICPEYSETKMSCKDELYNKYHNGTDN